MAKVLIVYYSLGGNTEHAAAIVRDEVEALGHEAVMKTGTEAGTGDLLGCEGLVVGTPDYFSYMAGGLKDFFDRTLYPSGGQAEGKPYFGFVTHGGGGRASDSIERIASSFKFRKVAGPVLVKGKPEGPAVDALKEAAGKLADSLG